MPGHILKPAKAKAASTRVGENLDLEDNEQTKSHKIAGLFLKIVCWIIVSTLIFYLCVVNLWDSLPEPYDGITSLCVIGGVVFGFLTASSYNARAQLITVVLLLMIGAFFTMRNNGIINESITASDIQILSRTQSLLAHEDNWDKSNSRDCIDGTSRFSLYCALESSTREIMGRARHRQPALDVVRELIPGSGSFGPYAHKLADYNYDPEVSFGDIHILLNNAIELAKQKTE